MRTGGDRTGREVLSEVRVSDRLSTAGTPACSPVIEVTRMAHNSGGQNSVHSVPQHVSERGAPEDCNLLLL